MHVRIAVGVAALAAALTACGTGSAVEKGSTPDADTPHVIQVETPERTVDCIVTPQGGIACDFPRGTPR